MKEAMGDFLSGKKPAEAAPAPEADFSSLFEGEEEGEEAADPLMSALQSAGFEVDEAKLSQIRAILEPTEGEGEAFGGMETPEEEAAEGGAIPGAMKGKPNL